MNNWIIGGIAVAVWLGATGLYLHREIIRWFVARRKAKQDLAKARAAAAPRPAVEVIPPGKPPG